MTSDMRYVMVEENGGGQCRMLQRLRLYCNGKKGAEEDRPFGPEPLVVKVGGKMFALLSAGGPGSGSISLKCDPRIAVNLREQYAAISPGYHLNKKHWNTVELDGSVPYEELCDMIDHSHELVVRGLPKAERLRFVE